MGDAMCQGTSLLDEALNLARQERIALEDGDYEGAIDLAARRGELTGMAWGLLEQAGAEQYRKRLIELTRLQEQLTDLAARARDSVRESLHRSRREQQRIRGYHQAVGHALQ